MNTKLIVGCISGAGALGGAIAGSYYLLNKEPEKSQETNDTPSQQEQQSKEVVPKAKPTQTLKEALMAGPSFTALDTEGREHDDHWKTLIAKHKGNKVAKKIDIDGEFAESTSADDLTNIKKLQKACSYLFEKTENYENDKETARNWCNKESELVKAK